MDAALRRMKQEAMECLTENILPFWLEKMQDSEHGGWYGRMDGHGQLYPQAEKGAILNARILWSLSAAYRLLWGECDGKYQDICQRCMAAATRTKDYFLRHFIDRERGGVFWSVDYLGRPLETKKQTYAIGFAIYGLSEYARICGDQEALHVALQLFEVLEQHTCDHEYGGYIEALTRTWQPIRDMRLSAKDENFPKSQNTHLHVIEPYTNLLRTCKELSCKELPCEELSCEELRLLCRDSIAAIEKRIATLITLFTDRLLNPQTHHLDLFFQMDWTRMSTTASYGHDIECSWLLHEAALVLGDAAVREKVEPVVRQVAAASEEGLLPCGAMIHESGDPDLHWWVQAEAVVGFLNIYQHFGDEAALEKALRLWGFIKDNLVDHELGEWYWSLKPEDHNRPFDSPYSVNRDEDHAGFWKCPYHNSRMCLEIIERCNILLK